MATSPPPPPDPSRNPFLSSSCGASSSSSSSKSPRPALRRSKTLANPESPASWRRDPLHDVTNQVLGREREFGRLQVRLFFFERDGDAEIGTRGLGGECERARTFRAKNGASGASSRRCGRMVTGAPRVREALVTESTIRASRKSRVSAFRGCALPPRSRATSYPVSTCTRRRGFAQTRLALQRTVFLTFTCLPHHSASPSTPPLSRAALSEPTSLLPLLPLAFLVARSVAPVRQHPPFPKPGLPPLRPQQLWLVLLRCQRTVWRARRGSCVPDWRAL